MVAQKKGRGAKNQAAKAKAAAQPVEEPAPEMETSEPVEAEDNNGEAEQIEHNEDGAGDTSVAEGSGDADQSQDNAEGDAAGEDKKEEKVESGKILVENLPSTYLFDYQEKLKELFSKHGEVTNVKRGPIIVTELTTTPTLSAIVEFKNKESLEKAMSEEGTVLEGSRITVSVESRAETAVLVGVPYEASTEYVKLLFSQCGEVTHIHEFSKTKYKILRVTFQDKDCVDKALKLDRELRINGFLVTVSKYRDEDEQKAHNAANVNKNKRQHPNQQQNRNNSNTNTNSSPNSNRANNFRARGGAFNARGNFRGARGRGGFGGRGGAFPRGGFAPVNTYMPPQGFMGRPQGGFMNDGQRPNKRLRQM
ncbi:heterogeneous nuclear ribonucleoprotein A1 isoform X1 [Spodoptera frugiperda]|uniref:Heterogeneous nuclear ribonucleoprotein A1 isoform X1 n=1 Tax=Spodoptera frugiperda TaxID=7108 RepID=A0A9R0CUY1_SPOFR|nr:heterogeneous nuclear ribonucleoprotein A1 isoform X1 [Spodoptera frugiperda]